MRDLNDDDPINFINFFDYSVSISEEPEEDQRNYKNEEVSLQLSTDAKKKSFKNKYLNKIKETKGPTSANSGLGKMEKNEAQNGQIDKRQKNKVAARESRDRKKMYIQIMEQQIKELQGQLKQTSISIQKCKVDIQKITYSNNQYIGDLNSKITHIYQKLSNLLTAEDNQYRNNQINLAIDSISYRFGATGKERKFNINQSYKQIFNLAYPGLHRYLLWCAQEQAHLFAPKVGANEENERWFQQIKQILQVQNLDQSFLQAKCKVLSQKRTELIGLIEPLSLSKQKLQKLEKDLDNLFIEVRQILNPIQSAKFILFIEKYSYRNEIRYHQRNYDNAQSQGILGRKMVKKENIS